MLSAEKTLKTVLDITKIKKHSFKVKYDSNKMFYFIYYIFQKKLYQKMKLVIFL